MQYLAVPVLILCSTVTLASAEVQPNPRAQADTQSSPPPAPPPVPQPPPPVTPRANPLPPPAPIAVPTSTPTPPATPGTETEAPEQPGWTGVVVEGGLGNLTRNAMTPEHRDYVSVGMEVHWERPQGVVRPGVTLRPDLMFVSGAMLDLGSTSRTRFDLASLLSVAVGEKVYARIALGPFANYNTAVKGVERLRPGLVAEAILGWRRAVGIYGEAKKTWGNDVTDLAVTFGVRFDLALLKKLN